ncbi:hypothetical protein ABZS95_43240 [Streptomyces sp. NPDC005479]|uniref:hypothetical protein n=1 Tax=unclassified Streptomyces TaxID=2593676 RepID=UPI0033A27CF6
MTHHPSPLKDALPLIQRPARLTGALLGAVLLLLGGVPLAERSVAHLGLWSAALPIPGLSYLVLLAAGAGALTLVWRGRHHTAGRPDPQER